MPLDSVLMILFQPSKVESWRSHREEFEWEISTVVSEAFFVMCVFSLFGGKFGMIFEFMNVYECSLRTIVSYCFSKYPSVTRFFKPAGRSHHEIDIGDIRHDRLGGYSCGRICQVPAVDCDTVTLKLEGQLSKSQ